MIPAADCLWVPTGITFEGSFVSFLPGESHFHWTMLSVLGSWLYPFIFWCHRDVVICFIFSNMPVTSLTYEDVRSQRRGCSPHNLTGAHTSGAVGSSPGWGKWNPACQGLAKKRFLQLPWWLRRWRVCLQCGRPGFDPWVGEIPWGREWQPTPSFLPEELHGRILAGCSSQGHKASDWTDGPTLSVTMLSRKSSYKATSRLVRRMTYSFLKFPLQNMYL